MILPYRNIKLNVEFYSDLHPENYSILFLHGFTGSANEWREISEKINPAFNKIALDLIGHGKSSSPPAARFYKIDEIVKQLLFVVEYLKIKDLILCGYSLGGRAAISFASAYPEKVSALILESTSAGIKDNAERKIRSESDEQLADYIDSHSIEEFVNSWLENELFSSLKQLPAETFQNLKDSKLKNSNIGLANSLRGFGTGVMPYFGSQIKKMKFPVLLISGRLDSKFTKLNRVLSKQFANGKHKIIDNAGHNVHIEEPAKFVSTINRFLQQF